ncbi:zinc-dependent metalloprotease family protein [Deltaproteobacteria bacterium TL4]
MGLGKKACILFVTGVTLILIVNTACSSPEEEVVVEKAAGGSPATAEKISISAPLSSPVASKDCDFPLSHLKETVTSPDVSTLPARSPQREGSSLSIHTLSLPDFNSTGTPGFFSTRQSFSVPAGTISFQISAFEVNPSLSPAGVQICSLTDPNGVERIMNECSLWVFGSGWEPSLPTSSVPEGLWSFEVVSGRQSATAMVGFRSDSVSSATLSIRPYLTGNQYSEADIRSALNYMTSLYENQGIHLNLEPVRLLSGTQFKMVTSNFTSDATAELVCKGDHQHVNLFFVEDLIASSNSGGSVLGIASGIPGPHGIRSRHNGVLIGLDAHSYCEKNNGTCKLDGVLLGETAAHEMGHWLGLAHTTESKGDRFDLLRDTEECPISFASNRKAGIVTVEDCSQKDGYNLMFWTAPPQGSVKRQTQMTPNQTDVLKHAPIIQ